MDERKEKSPDAAWQTLILVVILDPTFFNTVVGVWDVLPMYYALSSFMEVWLIKRNKTPQSWQTWSLFYIPGPLKARSMCIYWKESWDQQHCVFGFWSYTSLDTSLTVREWNPIALIHIETLTADSRFRMMHKFWDLVAKFSGINICEYECGWLDLCKKYCKAWICSEDKNKRGMFASCWVLAMLFQDKHSLEVGGFWKKIGGF